MVKIAFSGQLMVSLLITSCTKCKMLKQIDTPDFHCAIKGKKCSHWELLFNLEKFWLQFIFLFGAGDGEGQIKEMGWMATPVVSFETPKSGLCFHNLRFMFLLSLSFNRLWWSFATLTMLWRQKRLFMGMNGYLFGDQVLQIRCDIYPDCCTLRIEFGR